MFLHHWTSGSSLEALTSVHSTCFLAKVHWRMDTHWCGEHSHPPNDTQSCGGARCQWRHFPRRPDDGTRGVNICWLVRRRFHRTRWRSFRQRDPLPLRSRGLMNFRHLKETRHAFKITVVRRRILSHRFWKISFNVCSPFTGLIPPLNPKHRQFRLLLQRELHFLNCYLFVANTTLG